MTSVVTGSGVPSKVRTVTLERQLAPRHQGDPSQDEQLIRKLASWCRANHQDAMAETAVPGPTGKERELLAALGGIARSLILPYGQDKLRLLPDLVAGWVSQGPVLPTNLLQALQDALARDADPLALVYERLVSAPRRRPLGTFFTPAAISSYMRDLTTDRIPTHPRTVADPGAGVGAFTRVALEAWPEANVHAVDVNVVTLGLLAATPTIAASLSKTLSLHHADFLEWLGRAWTITAGPRLIWGNPPYTRHQGLSAEVKAAARLASAHLAPGGRAGLSTYFLAASLANLQPEDSLCLLLPSNWLEADYARNLRNHLWQSTERPVELHIFPHELDLFPIASVAAMVIWVGPEQRRKSPLAVHRLSGDLTSGFSTTSLQKVERSGPLPANFYFTTTPRSGRSTGARTVPLTSIARIRRGVATGCNNFFLLTDEQVEIMPEGTYVRAATRLRNLTSDRLDQNSHDFMGKQGFRRWLLWLTEEDAKNPIVGRLLNEGMNALVHEAYLCSVRKPWYALERIPIPDLLFGPMGKGRFRLVNNDIEAIPTNTFYGIKLRRKPASQEPLEALASWIRGTTGQNALIKSSRQHGSGTLKIEPRDLADLQIPARLAAALDPS